MLRFVARFPASERRGPRAAREAAGAPLRRMRCPAARLATVPLACRNGRGVARRAGVRVRGEGRGVRILTPARVPSAAPASELVARRPRARCASGNRSGSTVRSFDIADAGRRAYCRRFAMGTSAASDHPQPQSLSKPTVLPRYRWPGLFQVVTHAQPSADGFVGSARGLQPRARRRRYPSKPSFFINAGRAAVNESAIRWSPPRLRLRLTLSASARTVVYVHTPRVAASSAGPQRVPPGRTTAWRHRPSVWIEPTPSRSVPLCAPFSP
jgi:hypothetical protein